MQEECSSDKLRKAALEYRELVSDFPVKNIHFSLCGEKLFGDEHDEMIRIIGHGTPREFADYVKYVHWGRVGQ